MKNLDWFDTEKMFLNKNVKTNLNVECVEKALFFLGNPDKKIEKKVIHIAGTNGKGSVCSYIKTILEKSGYKVGVFTSPHLIEYNERFYFNGRFATDEEIEKCKNEILTKCKNAKDLSFFETTFIISVMLFSNYFEDKIFDSLDYFIFEVGLGGRLDATNIFKKPLICVITSISLDHMDRLGDCVEKIAFEKGGVIKQNTPVFTSNTNKNIIDVLQKIADEKNAKLFCQERDYKLDLTIKPSLLGFHQVINANLAIVVCKYIGIEDKFIEEGVSTTKWIGRMQKIKLKKINNDDLNIEEIYLDGGHNEDGVRVLCDFVKQQKNIQQSFQQNQQLNVIGIFSVLKRKDYKSFFPFFSDNCFDKLLFYNIPKEVNDFVEFNELKKLADNYNINSDKIDKFEDLNKHCDKSKKNIIFIFGSLYFVGFVLENFVENKDM